MAKQTGIHGLRGKVNGMSYYSSKNGGSLVRKINEGLSARVKSTKEYLNTRKNNAEFGMCGDIAGAIIKAFTIRWRFILISIATGMLVKKLKELVLLDTVSAWGQRVVKNTYFDQIRAAFNSFSKNEMYSQFASILSAGVKYDTTSHEIAITQNPTLSAETVAELEELGANYLYVKCFGFKATIPEFNAAANAYTKAKTQLIEIEGLESSGDLSTELDTFNSDSASFSENLIDSATELGAFVCVVMPARKVGSSISILQQHCAAYMVPVTAAE